jgi:hypothetical protein
LDDNIDTFGTNAVVVVVVESWDKRSDTASRVNKEEQHRDIRGGVMVMVEQK